MNTAEYKTDVEDGDVEREKSDQQKKVTNDSEGEKPKVLPRMKRSSTGQWLSW